MRTYQLVGDSSNDFSIEKAKALDIKIVPFSITFDGSTVYTEHKDLTNDEFYKKMDAEAAFPKTSQPTIQDYLDVFEPILKDGNDILCICLSSGISGSYQSAFNAKGMLEETYPDAKICVVDTHQATGSEQMVAYQAIAMREAGVPIEEAAKMLLTLSHEHAKLLFTVDSMDHLVKGGRVGKAAGLAGNILNIKPILSLEEGVIVPVTKVRSLKKAAGFIKEALDSTVGDAKDDYQVQVIYSGPQKAEAAKQWMAELSADGYELAGSEPIQLGICIGSHVGSLLLGLVYCKKYTAL